MAYPALTSALSAHRAASIKRVWIKTGSEKWQSLGGLRNGELRVSPYTTEDTYKRNLVIDAFTIEAKFELLQTALLEVEKIDSIVYGTNDFLFELTDAGAIPGLSTATEGWVVVTSTQVGAKARYVSDGNPSTNQFIEVMIKGTLKSSELDAALKASIATADFHISTTGSETFSDNAGTAGGTIFSYYKSATAGDVAGIEANRRANGFSTVQLQDALSTTYQTLGRVRNGKIVFGWLAEEDSLGRYNVYGVDVDVEYEILATDAATLLYLNTIELTNTDAKITLIDGKVFTLESKLGVAINYENVGDFDKMRVLRFAHKGRINSSEFDGVVS